MCQVSGSISQKRRGHLDVCAVKCKNHGLASKLLGFSVNSILGVKFDLIFGPTQSILRVFCAKLCTNMPWSTWKRLVQKKKGHFSRVNLQNVRGAIRRILACPGLRVRASTTMIPGTILTSNMSVTVGTLAIPGTRIYFAPGVRTRICCQRYTAVFR